MTDIRRKSVLLTGYLEKLLLTRYPVPGEGEETGSRPYVRIITPANTEERGAQLSVMFSVPIIKVYKELKKRGVVVSIQD